MDLERRRFLALGAGAVAMAGVAACAGLSRSGPGTLAAGASPAGTPQAPGPVAAIQPQAMQPLQSPTLPLADFRRAHIHNLHTGEVLDAVYWENGKYVPDALAEAMRVMRDWRNGSEHVMDPRLFDVLHGIQGKIGSNQPFQLISGYRSPQTNAMLHAESGQVAGHSQHMLGKASDIRVEGVQLVHLRNAALSLKAGGVGFYPVSNFVHVDVARVRTWSGT
jgi:uncharacterized protein YcbK (DUF882 family)